MSAALERARRAMGITGFGEREAYLVLEAALDVEEMARAMYGYAESKRAENPDALGHRPRRTWEGTSETNRQIFRDRASHLRAVLLGES